MITDPGTFKTDIKDCNFVKENRLLIIFVKNPRKGCVKTRLAETAGDEKAYQIYLKLVNYTFQNIPWSTENVYPETVNVLEKMDLRYGKLPVLNDIDTEEDLRRSEFG